MLYSGEREKKTNKLTQITTDKGETTRSKVLAAAEDRMDEEIRMRMLCHPDLFAFDAKYGAPQLLLALHFGKKY